MREQTQKEPDAWDQVTRYDFVEIRGEDRTEFAISEMGDWVLASEAESVISTLRAEQTRLREALEEARQLLAEMDSAIRSLVISCETEGYSGKDALAIWNFAMGWNGDLDQRVASALSSTPTPENSK